MSDATHIQASALEKRATLHPKEHEPVELPRGRRREAQSLLVRREQGAADVREHQLQRPLCARESQRSAISDKQAWQRWAQAQRGRDSSPRMREADATAMDNPPPVTTRTEQQRRQKSKFARRNELGVMTERHREQQVPAGCGGRARGTARAGTSAADASRAAHTIHKRTHRVSRGKRGSRWQTQQTVTSCYDPPHRSNASWASTVEEAERRTCEASTGTAGMCESFSGSATPHTNRRREPQGDERQLRFSAHAAQRSEQHRMQSMACSEQKSSERGKARGAGRRKRSRRHALGQVADCESSARHAASQLSSSRRASSPASRTTPSNQSGTMHEAKQGTVS